MKARDARSASLSTVSASFRRTGTATAKGPARRARNIGKAVREMVAALPAPH